MKTTGSKYVAGMDLKDIAKLVRADLKAKFCGFTFSVRVERYSGGQALHVDIKAVPVGVLNATRPELFKRVQAVVDAYNYDNCEDEDRLLRCELLHPRWLRDP